MRGTLGWFGKAVLLSAIGMALASPLLADSTSRERVRARFLNPTFFHGALLQGDYLITHDHDKIAKGEPCLFVHRERTGTSGEPVVSVHCETVERDKSTEARIATLRVSDGVLWSLREIQFAGATSAHQPH